MNELLEEIRESIQQVAQAATPPEPARGDDSGLRRELAATERRLRDSLRGMRSVKERSRPASFVMPVQSDAEKSKSAALVRAALRCRKGRYLSAAQLAMVGNANPKGCNQYTGPGCAAEGYAHLDLPELLAARSRMERDIAQERSALDDVDPHKTLRSSMAFSNLRTYRHELIKIELTIALKTDDKDAIRFHAKRLKTSTKDLTSNSNPEGCNQYTGPGCASGEKFDSQEVRDIKEQNRLSTKHLIFGKFTNTHPETAKKVIKTLEDLADQYGMPSGGIHIVEASGGSTLHRASMGQRTWIAVSKEESERLKSLGAKINVIPTRTGAGTIYRVIDNSANRLTLYTNGSRTLSGFDQSPDKYHKTKLKNVGHTVDTGDGVKDTITHEFGHSLVNRNLSEDEVASHVKEKPDYTVPYISRYALTSKSEQLAEAFVKYDSGDRTPALVKILTPYLPKKPTVNASPVVVSRLAPYLHELLGDVTKKQSRVIAQAIKRGIDRRWADSTVARLLVSKADIDPDRAKVIARTEMRRAKADIQLGKKRDSAKVVFTLGNEDACPICRALDGKVFTVRKAQGVIPVHPNCYCFWSDAAKGAKVTRNEVAPITNDFRDSLLRFSALNQFCATGEGGGIDPSCPSTGDKPSAPIGAEGAQIAPSKVSPKRSKQVLADADKLKVDDDLVHGKGDIDVDDLDAIEELLTGNEKRKLESYVESAREFYVDSQMEDFEATDFPEREWADEKGYGSTDLKDEVLARLKDWSNEEGVERVSEALEDWDKSTRQNGVEAMDELRGVLEDNDAPQFLKDEFDEKYASMENERDSARESWDENMERFARSEAENGFDAEESKNEFLRQFVEENSDDPRFGGGKRTYDTWGKSAEDNGDNQLFFQTSKGNEYEVWDNEQAMGQGGVPLRYREIGFNDAKGDFGVTGAGNAVEVFGKASAAVVKLLKEKDYDVASFTAAEPSRQRLYDRLVRTVSSVMPDYAAFSYQTDPGSPRRYVVAKKTKADQIRAEFAKLPNGKVDVLANADTPQLVPLTPEVREEWFTEAGWADTTDNAFCPTGEGGGVDPSCSPGGKGGSVDDIEDDYDRREARISRIVSRLGESDQERAILEKGLNGTTERALKLFDKNVSEFSVGRLESPESTVIPGIYRLTDKGLVVDQRAPDPDRTFVHEWGHALDGPKHDFSESPAWGKIWKEEIVGGAHSLSPYSKTSVYEGFAEFATLVRTDSKKAKSQFPRAYRYWTDADLTWDDA